MPKVSVIIPVYNTQKYLKDCLNSVINQTLEDIEIICINDGSKDNSLNILNEYALKDKRFKIINKENEGPAIARNIGIDVAKGDFIAFLDSDDCYKNLTHLMTLYNKAIENSADIAKSQYQYMEDGHIFEPFNKKINEDKNCFCLEYTSAIFKKELIVKNNIKFPIQIDMEDPVFAFNCALFANRVIICNDEAVLIRTRQDSLSHRILKFNQIKDKIKGLKNLYFLALNNPISEDAFGCVLGFWFSFVYLDSNKNQNLFIKLYYTYNIFKLYEKVRKRNYINDYIKKYNPYFLKDFKSNSFFSTLNVILKEIFSLKNNETKTHKILTFFGFKIKLRRKNA